MKMPFKMFCVETTMGIHKDEGYIGVRVPKKIKDDISSIIQEGTHLNEAEFVREAIREKIRSHRSESYV